MNINFKGLQYNLRTAPREALIAHHKKISMDPSYQHDVANSTKLLKEIEEEMNFRGMTVPNYALLKKSS